MFNKSSTCKFCCSVNEVNVENYHLKGLSKSHDLSRLRFCLSRVPSETYMSAGRLKCTVATGLPSDGLADKRNCRLQANNYVRH